MSTWTMQTLAEMWRIAWQGIMSLSEREIEEVGKIFFFVFSIDCVYTSV